MIIGLLAMGAMMGGPLLMSKSLFGGLALLFVGIATMTATILKTRVTDDRQLETESMPGIASRFGIAVNSEPGETSFENDGTVFHTKVEHLRTGGVPEAVLRVQYTIPGVSGKFTVQHNSSFSSYYHECPEVGIEDAPEEYVYHSLDAGYLRQLFDGHGIANELYRYPSNLKSRLRVMFDNGLFDLAWQVGGLDKRAAAEDLERRMAQVCETAIAFRDKMRAIRDGDK